mgnify:CR=1 FL=1|jgi:cysteine desulfurase
MRIYFDHAATSSVRSEVKNFLSDKGNLEFFNPSSVHAEGQSSRSKINNARDIIASLIKSDPDNILFTSSGTEACNYIINMTIKTYGIENIIYLPTEHKAVVDTIFNKKINQYQCKITNQGLIDLDNFQECISQCIGKTLVCVMLINNETGLIQPIEKISKICQEYDAYLFSDMIQALGKINIAPFIGMVDFASFASHKIGGIHGVGMVYFKDKNKIYKEIHGGEQEFGRRGGTENVIGIISFSIALQVSLERIDFENKKNNLLYNRLLDGLNSISKKIIIPCQNSIKHSSITTIIFPGLKAESLIMGLDMEGVAVSSGAACSSGKIGGSHVLNAMNYSHEQVIGAIRLSFGWDNNEDQVDFFLNVINNLLQGMKFKH